MSRWSRRLLWLLLVLSIVDWIALRKGVAPNPPAGLAVLVGLAMAVLLSHLVLLFAGLIKGRGRVAAAAEILLLTGILTALAGGLANWLLGLQGFVILNAGQSVPLHGGSRLQVFVSGPLARIEEMGIVLGLEKVDLVPVGDGSFYPRSWLALWRGQEGESLQIDPHSDARSGVLRFYQGAFGFSPQIVVVHRDEVVFDQVVPFVTRLQGEDGISFEGDFEVESEKLTVDGSLDLASLDEALRGHATLALTVRREHRVLGSGSLLPGHFAELEEGYRIGFVGLHRWSEIDVSRRNYGGVVIGGGLVALLGAVVWPIALWRQR